MYDRRTKTLAGRGRRGSGRYRSKIEGCSNMIRVTIEEFDNRGRVTRSVMRSSLEADADQDDFQPSIGEVIAYAISDFKPPRVDLVIAEIINVAEFVRYDYFAGRNDAIIALENAADTIANGWCSYDERME